MHLNHAIARCRAQLDRLAALGAHCAALEAFVEAAAAAAAEGAAAAAPCSLYRLALSNGVLELLDVYRSAVLAVEAHLAHAAAPPPLLAVQQFLLEWEVLLPEAAALVGEVEGRGLVGAGIMHQLALRAHSGVPALQSCAQRLLWHCRQVLFKQLESWLVHGLLLDRAGEFFIRRAGGAGASSPRRSAASPSPLRLGDGSAAAGGPMLDWEPLEWHAGFEVSGQGQLACSLQGGRRLHWCSSSGQTPRELYSHSGLKQPAGCPGATCVPFCCQFWTQTELLNPAGGRAGFAAPGRVAAHRRDGAVHWQGSACAAPAHERGCQPPGAARACRDPGLLTGAACAAAAGGLLCGAV